MAFCTECGFKLPEEAVFCPNCGATLTASSGGNQKLEANEENFSAASVIEKTESSYETVTSPEIGATQGVLQGTYTSPIQGEYTAPSQGSYSAPAQGSYNSTTLGNYPPPIQGAYNPQPQEGYATPQQNAYAPQYQNPSFSPEAYGAQPQPYNNRINTAEPKGNGGKIAAIVISSVVVLLALAGFFIYKAISGGNSYVGYWESCAVDVNGVETEVYEDENVVGLLGVQINDDGTAFMCAATDDEIYEGQWKETEDGITVTDDEDTYLFTMKDGKLYLDNDTFDIVFKKSKGDINNPSIPHGSLSDSGEEELVNMPGTVIGSGYVGNEKYYLEIIGAEDTVDVDGESAIRVYYEFTNYFDYPVSDDEALGFEVSQGGNELVDTYAAEDCDVEYNYLYKIRTGVTIQCCYVFKYNPTGGVISFSIGGWDEGEEGGTVDATIDPSNLPGAPAPYVIMPVADPQWTTNIPGEGTLDDYYYVVVQDAELIEDYNGSPAIRIYYQFTNNSAYSISLAEALMPYTYQDGISLDTTYDYEDSESDINYTTQIAPGATIQASCVFALRNTTSPVEAEIEANNTYDAVGQTYDIT